MNKNTVDGTIKEAKGTIQKEWGKATGNTGHQVKGSIKEAVGGVQRAFGEGQEEGEREDREDRNEKR